MLKLKYILIGLIACASAFGQTTKISPDCPVLLGSRTTTGTSSVYDNRPQSAVTSPCTEFIFTASATTTNVSFTVLVQGATDNGAVGCAGCTWSTFASLTLSAEGVVVATKSYADYIRINLTAITSGAVSAALSGWRPDQATTSGGVSPGGPCPITTFFDGSVVFIHPAGVCDQSANFTYAVGSNTFTVTGSNNLLTVFGVPFSSLSLLAQNTAFQSYTNEPVTIAGQNPGQDALALINDLTTTSGFSSAAYLITTVTVNNNDAGAIVGVDSEAWGASTTAGQTLGEIDGLQAQAHWEGPGTLTQAVSSWAFRPQTAGGTLTNSYDFRAEAQTGTDGGTVVNAWGLFIENITGGTTSNHAIQTGLGRVEFGDVVQLDNLTASLPVTLNAQKQLINGSYHGNPSVFQMSDGTGTSGNFAKFNADGRVTDGGGIGAINGGTGSGSVTIGALSDGNCGSGTFTVTGAAVNSNLAMGFPNLTAGLHGTMFVSASNTVTVEICNLSGGALTPGALTYSAEVVK